MDGYRKIMPLNLSLVSFSVSVSVSLSERGEGGLEAYGGAEGGGAGGDPAPPGTPGGKRKSGEELRELWRKAILQQILLLRMETENQRLQGKNTARTHSPISSFGAFCARGHHRSSLWEGGRGQGGLLSEWIGR